jgi:hypothetical protein
MVGFKLICPKWHLGQVGHGGKKSYKFFFFDKIPGQKAVNFFSGLMKTNMQEYLQVAGRQMRREQALVVATLNLTL